jgi:hypothetical protein
MFSMIRRPALFTGLILSLGMLTASVSAQPVQPDQPVQPPPPQVQPQQQPNQMTNADQACEQAYQLLKQGDIENAKNIIWPLAQQGHPRAQFFVALMTERGDGFQQNHQEAVRWYTHSSLGGFTDSMYNLALKYYKGEGVPQNLEHSASLFLLNALHGDSDGMWATGVCFQDGDGRQVDLIEAATWFIMSAHLGNQEAQTALSTLQQQLTQEQQQQAQQQAQVWMQHIQAGTVPQEYVPAVPIPPFMANEVNPNQQPQPQPQQNPNQPQTQQQVEQLIDVQLNVNAEFTPLGSIKGRAVFVWPAELYGVMKQLVPDAKYFLRDLTSGRADIEIAEDAKAWYEDDTNSVVLDLHLLGAIKNVGDNRWVWEVEDEQYVGIGASNMGRTTVSFTYDNKDENAGIHLKGQAIYTMPVGATDIQWSEAKQELSFTLPYTGPAEGGRMDFRFDARDQLMSCLYKVYGLETEFAAQWVAKGVFTNIGAGPLSDLRVRFRVAGYSEWSMWQKFPVIVPGQTVVAVYKPVLNKSIAELTSTTPANVLIEWRYVDGDGDRVEDSDGERISVLGRHDFVFSNLSEDESTGSYYDAFSNAHFIAAWATRDDPVVKQFAAMANKAAGGQGAPYSDEAAIAVLKSIYELWQANDFTYQGPVGIVDPNMSFDNNIVQSIKFPRDVIRDKSGTCIELAALYCSMAHSVGLKPYMVLVPGHAFPVVQLPSGNYLPVESTGVGGGQRYGTASFEQVVQAATETYQKYAQEGTVIEVDIEAEWSMGVSCPELEPLPADILQRWNIVLNTPQPAPSPQPGPAPTPQPGPQPTPPTPTPNPAPQPGTFLGQWAGQASEPMPDGSTLTYPIVMEITDAGNGVIQCDWYGEADIQNQFGGTMHVTVFERFLGQMQNGRLGMAGQEKTVTIDGQQQTMPGDQMMLTLTNNQIMGQIQIAMGGQVSFQCTRAQ